MRFDGAQPFGLNCEVTRLPALARFRAARELGASWAAIVVSLKNPLAIGFVFRLHAT